jgi:hypothetical protein
VACLGRLRALNHSIPWQPVAFIVLLGMGIAATVLSAVDVVPPGQIPASLSAVRPCTSGGEARPRRPSRRHDVFAQPVVFHGLRGAARLALRRPSRAFRSKDNRYPPVTVVAEVAPGVEAVVSVAPRNRGRARLVYRLPLPESRHGLGLEEGQVVVRFQGCPPSQGRYSIGGGPGPSTRFVGRFLVTDPQCLGLVVRDLISGRRRRYVVPYGLPRSRCLSKRAKRRLPAKRKHRRKHHKR